MTRLELQLTLAQLQASTAKLNQLTKQWDAAMALHEKLHIAAKHNKSIAEKHLGFKTAIDIVLLMTSRSFFIII